MSKFQIDTVVSETPNDAVNLETSIVALRKAILKNLTICFPASILSYDRENHIAEVQPLVKQGFFAGEWVYKVRKSYKVRVRAIQQGGFTIDVPLFRGDTGWVISSDRDTTLLKQEGAYTASVLEKDRSEEEVSAAYPQKPSTLVLHDLASGFFIPDNWGRFEIDRYKDGGGVNPTGAIYIGQSIDTKDQDAEKGSDSKKGVTPQTGDCYESKVSSSLLIERHGGTHLLSSSKKEDQQSVRVTVKNASIEQFVYDAKRGITVQSMMSTSGGITVSQMHDYRDMFFLDISSDKGATLRSAGITINLTSNGIAVMADGNINVNSKGAVAISTEKDAVVSAETVDVVSDGDIRASAGGVMSVEAEGSLNLVSAGNMTVQAAGNIHINSPEADKPLRFQAGKVLTIIASNEFEMDDYSYKNISVSGTESGEIAFQAETVKMESTNAKEEKSTMSLDKGNLEIQADGNRTPSISAQDISIDSSSVKISGKRKSIQNYMQGWIDTGPGLDDEDRVITRRQENGE